MATPTACTKKPYRQPWLVRKMIKRLPIVIWLPKYTSDQLISDAIAGITVGLTVMPQALAYATLAGLEPQVRSIEREYLVKHDNTSLFPVWIVFRLYGMFYLRHIR